MGHISLSMVSAISLLREQKLTNPMIAKKLGVTSLQVHYYHNGKTKTPNPVVCMSLYTQFKVAGKSILFKDYDSYEQLEDHYNLFKEHKDAV